ncbi:MAG: hypothetical protein ED555_14165 [Allomuricauda sp.]|nr:MAG: hypothetical protein ED555_14165 [Allomuricauda sp.]
MSSDYTSSDFKKLLDKLQTESWQLELIISGFAIYGLFSAIEPLEVELLTSVKNNQTIYNAMLQALKSGTFILMGSLLIHVILRGLWIGTLGLRYISGDIDYDELRYAPKFNKFLKTRVGSFDRYISRLENACSTVFALAFLMVFYFLSYFLILMFFAIVAFAINNIGLFSSETAGMVTAIFGIVYFVLILIFLFDFLTMGGLKRDRWTAKYYYPLYRFFGIITLAFMYRPLVYNFLDQKKARWVATFILPIYTVGLVFLQIYGVVNSNYQIEGQGTSSYFTSKYNYEDQLTEKTDFVQFVSLPSKVIDKPYMRVYVGFNKFLEDAVLAKDSTLMPEKDRRGYSFKINRRFNFSGLSFNFSNRYLQIQKDQSHYLDVLGELYQLKIDSVFYDKDFVMTNDTNKRLGFETYLDIKGLENGKHLLYLIGPDPRIEKELDTLITIPFWYFED